MVNFFQSLQGTVWQERLLFLQENTETYRWVCVGVCVFVYLVLSIVLVVWGRRGFRLNVGAVCFIPILQALVIPVGVCACIGRALGSIEKKPKVAKEKKSKSKSSNVEDDEGIDLF